MRTVLWVSLVVSSVLGGTGPTAGQSPLVAAVLVPTPASAQEGALAGRVLDAAGDPLPGVTVEVLGSAPGETRLEVTDREGRYRIDDLLPGAYAVWFTLPGFQWVVGDLDVDVGVVDVGTGRVTTVDAEMAIGGLESSVSVSSSSPRPDGAAALKCAFLPNGVIAECRPVTR